MQLDVGTLGLGDQALVLGRQARRASLQVASSTGLRMALEGRPVVALKCEARGDFMGIAQVNTADLTLQQGGVGLVP